MKRPESQQILELYELYKDGMSMINIGSTRGFSAEAIRNWFIKEGLDTKLLLAKPRFDYTYFHNIDTTRKAYYLGFLFADGCVCRSNYTTSIYLQEKDSNIIYSLHKDLKSQLKIHYKNAYGNVSGQYGLSLNSKDMYYDLINLGVKPNKSAEGMDFPLLNSYLMPHFIRGFFDGDGCIYLKQRIYKDRKNGLHRMMKFTCTSKSFIEKLREEIHLSCDALGSIEESSNYSKINNRITTIYNLRYWRVKDLKSLYDYLYNNSDICLERKRLKMEQAMLTVRESLGLTT